MQKRLVTCKKLASTTLLLCFLYVIGFTISARSETHGGSCRGLPLESLLNDSDGFELEFQTPLETPVYTAVKPMTLKSGGACRLTVSPLFAHATAPFKHSFRKGQTYVLSDKFNWNTQPRHDRSGLVDQWGAFDLYAKEHGPGLRVSCKMVRSENQGPVAIGDILSNLTIINYGGPHDSALGKILFGIRSCPLSSSIQHQDTITTWFKSRPLRWKNIWGAK